MYKFNNDNIITGYIKQLLHSFNLPKCKVFKTVEDFKEYYNNIPADIVGVFGIVKKYRQDRDYILYLTKSEKIPLFTFVIFPINISSSNLLL